MLDSELPKAYDPATAEPKILEKWDASGYANPDNLPGDRKETFSMVLPPPNVTGTLHTGHAMMVAVQDTIARYERMRGKKVLWLPGTDHAAIATQSKVEKELSKEKVSKYDLGREAFLARVKAFATASHDTIVTQLKSMGASLDWSREAFTLDEARTHAVNEAFVRMYNTGLIYRGNRIVNWDPKGQTTVSDDEVKHEERDATLYTFKYSKEFPIAISTSRPETKVGDTAVAVHPKDTRYIEFVGKEYDITFCGVPLTIRIVADDSVDPEFGTGALGVTPAHSAIDWDIAERNNLPRPQVIDERARMMVDAPNLSGKKVLEAREIIVSWLKENNLLEKEETIKQNVSVAERTGGIIEPLPKLQWWIDVNKKFTIQDSRLKNIPSGSETTLKEIMREAVASGAVTILPDRFEKIYFNWIDNLRDWCISRQIWYGHRVPVWYRKEHFSDRYVGVTPPTNSELWEQDPDTLDTWFSSGLWTFSTLGWPHSAQSATRGAPGQENDFINYHPTNLLETGYDILFFWVARMVLMSGFFLGDVPFRTVYLHGLVRDEQKRKMSKSLGNALDPLELTKVYGTDALRMALLVGNGPGNDLSLGEQKIKAYKLFANKIWNASKFVLMSTTPDAFTYKLMPNDAEELEKLHAFAKEVTDHMEKYQLYLAAEKLYHEFWHNFADVIIERAKEQIKTGDEAAQRSAQRLLAEELVTLLTLLHPFMPFITEHVWAHLPTTWKSAEILMIAPWKA